MKVKKMLVLVFVTNLFMSNYALATVDDEISQLKATVAALQKSKDDLELARTNESKAKYIEVRSVVYKAVQNSPKLETKFDDIVKESSLASLLIDLGDATNPSSDALGAKFNVVILESAKASFLKMQSRPSAWERFSNIVTKIMENPIVGTAIKANPISSLVGSVIQTAAGFSDTTNHGISREAKTEDVIDNTELKNFTEALAPYTAFYDIVAASSTDYQLEKSSLKKRNTAVSVSVTGYTNKLVSALKLKPEESDGVYALQLGPIFSKDPNVSNYKELEQVLLDQRVKDGYEQAIRYPNLVTSVQQFQDEYSTVLNTYLNNYKTALKSLDPAKVKKFDPKKINALVAKIEAFQSVKYKEVLMPVDLVKQPQLFMKSKDDKYLKFDVFK